MAVNRRDFLKLLGVGAGTAALSSPAEEAAAGNTAETAEEAKNQPTMLYDTTLCVGCRACQTACREWNETADELGLGGYYDMPDDLSGDTWTLIQLYKNETAADPNDRANWSFIKLNCMHCLEPACVSACTVGALQKSAEGPVVYDIDRCFGCRYCMVACPYHVPRYQWDTTTPLVQKCTFCSGYVQRDGTIHEKNRLAQGMGPNCVEACPTGALLWGPREEVLAEAHARTEAEPGKYHQDRVYGEHEAGGALQLILSHLPFEKLGLPKLDPTPLPGLTSALNWSVPGIFIGIGGLMAAVYGFRTRNKRQESEGEEA